MLLESHDRARALVDRAMLEGLTEEERQWLEVHLDQCAGCAHYLALSSRTVRALDAFAFDMDPAAAKRIQNVVRERAAQMPSIEPNPRRLWLATAAALLLTIVGSAAVWRSAEWLAVRWQLPAATWQAAFVVFWVLPSLLLAAVPLVRGRFMQEESEERGEII